MDEPLNIDFKVDILQRVKDLERKVEAQSKVKRYQIDIADFFRQTSDGFYFIAALVIAGAILITVLTILGAFGVLHH